jgi:hypothetical protein
MSKKAYIVLGIILVLIVGAGVTLVIVSKKTTTTSTTTIPTPATTTTTTTAPTTGTTGTATTPTGTTTTPSTGATATTDALERRTTDQVISPILSFQGNQIWYFTADGNLEQLDLSTATLQKYVLPKALTVSSAIWPLQGSDFILVSINSNGTKAFNYYNSANKTFTTYPANVKEAQFMPSGNQVIYVWDNGNNTSSLSIADPSLANHKQLVASLPDADDTVVISPLGDHVLMYNASAPANNKLYLMALSDTKIHTIKTGPENAAIWSNDGKHFVFNKYNTTMPSDTTLWSGSVASATSDTSLGITVPVSKLAFNTTGDTLYYAAPDSGASSAASSSDDSEQTQAITLPDSLWSYSFATAAKTEVFSGNIYNLNATNLLISNDGKTLYFKNGDGYLYSVVVSK